jgi:hypothetical protein
MADKHSVSALQRRARHKQRETPEKESESTGSSRVYGFVLGSLGWGLNP